MKKVVVALLITFVITACKMGENYQGVQYTTPEAYRSGDSERFRDTIPFKSDTLALDSLIGLNWFELFQDEVLDSLIRKGLENNQDLAIAAENVYQAQLALQNQRVQIRPSLNYSGSVGRGNFGGFALPNEVTSYNGVGNLSWEIDFWGKFRRLTEAAQARYLQTEEGYRAAKISLVETIAATYFDYIEFKARLEISYQNLAIRDSSLQVIQDRFDGGIVPEIDLNQAQIQRAIAAASIPLVERTIIQTENLISILTGVHPQVATMGKTLYEQDTMFNIPAGLPSDLLKRRPDIVAAEQEVIATNAEIGVAIANRFPNISLTGSLGVATSALTGSTKAQTAWNISGGITGPLFFWNTLKRNVDIARSQNKQSVLNYEATVLNALREVEDNLGSIETLKREIIYRQDHVKAALRAQDLSKERYDQGVTSFLEYLESQRQAFEAQQNYAGTKADLLRAYAQLYKVLGGGWNFEEE
jgi:multidrug efflux system outer membrane protein